MPVRPVVIVLLFLLSSQPSSAVDRAPIREPACDGIEAHALQVIQRAVQAQGGEAALRSEHSRRETGTQTILLRGEVFREASYLRLQKSPNQSYLETPANLPPFTEKLIFATDGTTSWTQNDGALAPYALPPAEGFKRDEEAHPFYFTLCERGVQVSYVGREELDGEVVDHLRYLTPDPQLDAPRQADVYFTADTGLPREVTRTLETSQGTALSRYRLFEYRRVGNQTENLPILPHRTESLFPPDERHINVVESLEINVEIPDSAFRPPAAPELSEQQLRRLAGTYELDGTSLTISRHQGELWIQLPAKPRERLIAVTRERFLFQDGRGAGSAMGNVQFSTVDRDSTQLQLQLRREATVWRRSARLPGR